MADDEPRNEEFQTKEYWDKRYAAEKPEEDYDWFKTYSDLEPMLSELIPDKESKILMLGCGNSTLSIDMFNAGYTRITNLDYSDVLIAKMKDRFPQMDWRVMDVRELGDRAVELGGRGTWDVVLDKGTMDALMAEKGSVWDPSDTVRENVRREVDGTLELLKAKTGIFIYLTWMQKHFREPYLLRSAWTIETRTLGDMFHYFLYIGRKH
ncbi:hypothetical protein CBS101457_001974 [Exobasidium rhododendri]|nr:hypothetical protein CBS101457_001974 [Exobasidium rhododendri]